nr:DUF1376 domain-containing protein [uncultured Gellertiella sp.]
MSTHLHWMKLFVGDELARTTHMNSAEFGAYMLLQMSYWEKGSLPPDEIRLARIARVSEQEWRSIKPQLADLFEEGWTCPRLDVQRKEAEERHKKLSENGRKGARSRGEQQARLQAGLKPGLSNQNQNQNQNHNTDSDGESESDGFALEKRGGSELTMFRPLPKMSAKDAAEFMKLNGPPLDEALFTRAVQKLMAGELTLYDIEGMAA